MVKLNKDDAVKGGLDSLQLISIASRLADDTIDAIQIGGSSAINEEVLIKEVAEVVVMLVKNGYMTGQTLSVNGGWYFT